MSQYLEICDCGCHKDTHFLDGRRPGDPSWTPTTFRGRCLGAECQCSVYRPPGTPDPAVEAKRPNHASWCLCARCKQFL